MLTGDPPEMAEAAAKVFARAEAGESTLHLSRFTVAEVVWTLERAYKIARQDIARELLEFLCSPALVVDDRDVVLESLNISFGDAIVADGDPPGGPPGRQLLRSRLRSSAGNRTRRTGRLNRLRHTRICGGFSGLPASASRGLISDRAFV